MYPVLCFGHTLCRQATAVAVLAGKVCVGCMLHTHKLIGQEATGLQFSAAVQVGDQG